ncbi:hypothetical protein [Gordonia amicalis]|uniref:hypothetical protein n=1 Tax=Gordonia amicalis TaxID=89053 RepID=UPI0024BBDDDA|nr:hypothetical protein [Gordonia amicalis]MDJ0454079.1 hypothetical protein [Gordonia amicalis]MDV7077223.1 hypothetical protein [Gordonia amicalis]
MMAGKTAGKGPVWARRWVWTSLAALAIFGAGVAIGAGSQGDDGSRCAALSHVEAVDHG